MSQLIKFFTEIGSQNIALIILLLSAIIDISPIKINPWKWILGKIGAALNKSINNEIAGFKSDVYQKIEDLRKEQRDEFDEIKREQEVQAETLNGLILDMNHQELSRLRWDIIDFEAGIGMGNKYPREQYWHIIDEGEKFIRIAEDKSLEIDVDYEDVAKVKEAIKNIKKHYEEQQTGNVAAYFMI